MNILNYYRHTALIMANNIAFMSWYKFKPTGQSMGLKLSLAYDIVKANGGELKVSSKENEGTTFTIQLQNIYNGKN